MAEKTQTEQAIDAIEAVEDSCHQFEAIDALAMKFGMTGQGLLNLFEGRVLFMKIVGGKPRLRTVDVERLFES